MTYRSLVATSKILRDLPVESKTYSKRYSVFWHWGGARKYGRSRRRPPFL